jgi:hypothetical protein
MRPGERDQMIMRCEQAKISISDDGEDYPLAVLNYGAYGTKNQCQQVKKRMNDRTQKPKKATAKTVTKT